MPDTTCALCRHWQPQDRQRAASAPCILHGHTPAHSETCSAWTAALVRSAPAGFADVKPPRPPEALGGVVAVYPGGHKP